MGDLEEPTGPYGIRPGPGRRHPDDEPPAREDPKRCANCSTFLKVREATARGEGMVAIAFGVGKPCADCKRCPGIGRAMAIMSVLGAEPKDRWTPIEQEHLELEQGR